MGDIGLDVGGDAGIGGVDGLRQARGLLNERIASLEYFVGSARDMVASLASRAERGELTQAEAQARAIESLANLSFGEDGYIFAFDSDIRIVAHPRRALGDSMRDFQDKSGLYLYRELKATADRNPQTGGFVGYMSQRSQAGSEEVPKMSYAAGARLELGPGSRRLHG